jgi:hypothetical protein
MRTGAHITCLVNSRTGRETELPEVSPISGERILVLGAGPAGLTFADMTASRNQVIVRDVSPSAGGSFRYTGLAPAFEAVDAVQDTFAEYIEGMKAACASHGAVLELGAAETTGQQAEGFDRIVIATGARYPLGLTKTINYLLGCGIGHMRLVKKIWARPWVKELFFYRIRHSNLPDISRITRAGRPRVVVIGDAQRPGRANQAIQSAYLAALIPTLNDSRKKIS